MTERFRRNMGIILIVLSVMICFIPVVFQEREKKDYFRHSHVQPWTLKQIPAEEHGSISVNTADEKTLTELPGIGEKTASKIIEERKENGPFFYPEDLEAVKGIGLQTIRHFYEKIDLKTEGSGE